MNCWLELVLIAVISGACGYLIGFGVFFVLRFCGR